MVQILQRTLLIQPQHPWNKPLFDQPLTKLLLLQQWQIAYESSVNVVNTIIRVVFVYFGAKFAWKIRVNLITEKELALVFVHGLLD